MKNNTRSPLPRTCVHPEGRFVYGLHQPAYSVVNLRQEDHIRKLGHTSSNDVCDNTKNYPAGDVHEPGADPIYEIPNAFPFKGTTYIGKGWAEGTAQDLSRIAIDPPGDVCLGKIVQRHFNVSQITAFIQALPRPLQLALATVSTDPDDLIALVRMCCQLTFHPETGEPDGLVYATDHQGRTRPAISDERLFDCVANNPHLPDRYKEVMVLRPGVQGQSEIVGDHRQQESHVYEYLRRNSYIPWGHYAANMAHDAIRYAAGRLTSSDIAGLRHLYYQRTFVRLARDLGIPVGEPRRACTADQLERLREKIHTALQESHKAADLPFTATLWGWNYGFDYAPSGFRLHASHQQIHQQYAMIPAKVPVAAPGGTTALTTFACGDMVYEFCEQYRDITEKSFFDCYHLAIAGNQRMDGRNDRPASLVVYQDTHVMLFVPKAQTSQWELQLMTRSAVGNILEADTAVRNALDLAMLKAMRILTGMGATMITVFEYSKRFDHLSSDQRLLYTFLPRLPESPGAFSEAQLRWINGHYPEDFAAACRNKLEEVNAQVE